MARPNQHKPAARPASRAAVRDSPAAALARTRAAAVQKRAHKPPALTARAASAAKEAAAAKHSAKDTHTQRPSMSRPKGGGIGPMALQLDLASVVGLRAADDGNSSADGYGSDDDLGDSQEKQAVKMHAALIERMEGADQRLLEQWLVDDQNDYQRNRTVLDQSIVSKRLEALASFARHLRKVGKNRSSLLTRLAEPLAEEHWLLGPNYHQSLVDAFQSMNGMINQLPSIATAAKHCLSPRINRREQAQHQQAQAREAACSDTTSDNARRIAQMEKLIHEVEQAEEWLHSNNTGVVPLPAISLPSALENASSSPL